MEAHATINSNMAFLDILTNIFTTFLIGYLGITNLLADKIESFLPNDPNVTIVTDKDTSAESDGTVTLKELSKTFAKGIPSVLLENKEFQQAALIASQRDEAAVSDTQSVPVIDLIKSALVNVYCQYKTDDYIRTTTGSGFFVNEKGVILTNAHVAQFLLLQDMEGTTGTTECVIRTGDPATPKYRAELLYISPTWIFENAELITDETPQGTGERDYALLYVSSSIDSSPLPTRFPAISIDTSLLPRKTIGSSVMSAGYPAEALLRGGADAKLLPIVSPTTIKTLYTFGSNYADIFSISESATGEQGASGGPVVASDTHNALGLIVTKGDEETEGAHSLRALSLSYVDRTINEETGFTLTQNMQGDIAYRGGVFKKAMIPFLGSILRDELIKVKE